MIVAASDAEREKRMLAYEATRSCRHCGKCHRPLARQEHVWRMRINHRFAMFGWTYDTLPLCEMCATQSDWRTFEAPAPCEYCGRIVHNELRMIDRKHVYCCTNCESQAQARKARLKRAVSRGTMGCVECGKTFRPTRIDAKFCGSACRQKAYRSRVTDNKSVSPYGFNSRNEHPSVTDNDLPSVTPNQ